MTACPHLETGRLILRPFQAEDLDALAAIRADERVARFTGGPRSRTDVWTTILRSAGMWELLGFGYWAACDRESGALIGEVGFADFQRGMVPDISGLPEAGWIIAPEAWGAGLASEAVAAIHAWLDSARPGRSVCIISPENAASVRIALKQGYRETSQGQLGEARVTVYHREPPQSRA